MEEIKQSSQPTLFILGPTASGKSKLALDLASHFKLHILNADSLQIYESPTQLMTAKPSPSELEKAPHHLYGFVPLSQTQFTVSDYVKKVDEEIQSKIHSEGKFRALFVGGTNYYMENLLFTRESEDGEGAGGGGGGGESINFEKEELQKESELQNLHSILVAFEEEKRKQFQETMSSKSSILMHELMSLLDPPMKTLLHTKEHRKIMNALFRIYKHKKTVSQRYLEAPKLRVKKPLVIILQASKKVLEQRIRKRAGIMLQTGLQQIFRVFEECAPYPQTPNFKQGVLQAIGYKQFYSFYTQVCQNDGELFSQIIQNNASMDEVLHNKEATEASKLKLIDCKEKLIIESLQYAKYQLKYIRNKIKPFLGTKQVLEIELDGELCLSQIDPKEYEEKALSQAIGFLENVSADTYVEQEIKKPKKGASLDCQYCKVTILGEESIAQHLASKKHKHFKSKGAD